jgi:hypothetical protein
LIAVAGLAAAGPARAQTASFDYSPTQPFTGDVITFTSTSDPGVITWDLNGDDVCDNGSGSVITHAFVTAGSYPVTICLNGGSSRGTQTITVLNRPPTASFTMVPGQPLARDAVVLTSTSSDPDGPIVAQEWDLDGDGAFDDAIGEIAQYVWRRPGSYPIGLRVADRDGAVNVVQVLVVVAPRPAGLLTPAPFVRVVGSPTERGAHLSLLTITAPEGANVGVRCKARNCPYRRKRFISKGNRVNLRALRRTYRAGSQIEIRVTKPETIGHYTRLRIRAGKRPARVDRCLLPGKPNKPVRCPTG